MELAMVLMHVAGLEDDCPQPHEGYSRQHLHPIRLNTTSSVVAADMEDVHAFYHVCIGLLGQA